MEINLQFFGGRGADGPSLGGGSGEKIDIISKTDVWSYRHDPNNADFVDQINTGVARIQNDFNGVMQVIDSVGVAELGGADKVNTLGFFGTDGLHINQNYTNIEKMNKTYDKGVQEGYHPGRGKKSAVEAVTLHEMGHALTEQARVKLGLKSLDAAAKKIVDSAYKKSGSKGGTLKFGKSISGYASHNNAECIAEAVSDYYCNGNRANANSKAIVKELKTVLK